MIIALIRFVQTLMQSEIQPVSASARTTSLPASVTSRLPSLDGWRALSILMVLGKHVTYVRGFPFAWTPAFNFFFDGNLGVRFFFTISGFLITWLMVLEREKNGSVNVREFYIRRCLRILPIYFVYLLVLALLDFSGLAKESSAAWLGNLTFTRNSFGAVTGGDSLSAHLWSLSVEEQFYLAWPVLFIILGNRKNDRSLLGLLLLAILAWPAGDGVMSFYSSAALRSFFSWTSLQYFSCLAFGCAGAILFARHREALGNFFKRFALPVACLGVFLVLIPYYLALFPGNPIARMHLQPDLQALGFLLLLLHSLVAPQWAFYRALNWKWIRHIGIWSYSLYIWQQLFWRPPPFGWLEHYWWMGLWIPPLFAVTLLSYYGLERPFFKLRSRHREIKIAG